MCLYLKTQEVVAEGILASFGNSSMSIIIPDYDIEKQLYYQDIKMFSNKSYEDNKETTK